MPVNFSLTNEFLGYVTSEDETKLSPKYLRSGSKNVLIDREKKCGIRAGFTFALETGEGQDSCKSGNNWLNSSGRNILWRFNSDDALDVFIGTVDGTVLNSWYTIQTGLDDTYPVRATPWYNSTEKLDELLFVNHSSTLRRWNGAIAIVSSIPDGTHITKTGSTTWAQNRFYTAGNKTMVCVRTGTVYTYTAGETSTNLTVSDSTGLVAGDILYQSIVSNSNIPESGYVTDNIFSFNNNVFYSSEGDSRVFMSVNTDPTTFAPSSPRIAGQGNTFTLDGAGAKFGIIAGKVVMFVGDLAYLPTFTPITVGSTLAETIVVQVRSFGSNQGAHSQETLIQVDDAIVLLSKEPALRLYESFEQITDRTIKALSNPIKPDFDAEDWTNAVGAWHGSRVFMHSRANSKTYILEWIEDAEGSVRRYWNPPQTLPVGAFIQDSGYLYSASSGDGKTLLLFNGSSDYVYDFSGATASKTPIEAVMKLAYNPYGKRGNLKSHDELMVEGEISPNTDDLLCQLEYDFGGATAINEQYINGGDLDIILESLEMTSLGQQSLGSSPIGGGLSDPAPGSHFQTILEYSPDDYYLLGINFSTNELDRTWTIMSVGPNVRLSNRRRR